MAKKSGSINIQFIVIVAVVGLAGGVVIGEFFPKLFASGLMGSIGNAVSEPFSSYRNELALKYGLFGTGIGAVIGLIAAFLMKK